jgi:hypothetical protein
MYTTYNVYVSVRIVFLLLFLHWFYVVAIVSIDGVMIRVIRSWVQTSVGQRQYNWYLLLRGQAHSLKGNFAIFYMLAKYVPGDIKYIFIKFYRHISTNNEANRKFVIHTS